MTFIDVRPDLTEGRDPYPRIMETVEKLSPEETLELMTPIEPIPLYRVMEARGFEHETRRVDESYWHVTFRRV